MFTNTPKLALPSGATKGDGAGTWVTQWNQLCDNVEARLTKSGSGSPVGVVAGEYIGQQYYRIDLPQRWFCTTTGAAGTAQWTDAVTLTNTLITNGVISAAGGINIAGGSLTLGAGLKFQAPLGENWLRQNSVDMNPHQHGATRHRLGGSNGAWISALDPLSLLIQDIQFNALISTVTTTGTYVNRVQITRNFTGRSGSSKVLAIGLHNTVENGAGHAPLDIRITRDSVTPGSIAAIAQPELNQGFYDQHAAVVFEYFAGIPVGSHTFEVQSRHSGANDARHTSSYLLLLDLGDA